jgi:hypothetical protein
MKRLRSFGSLFALAVLLGFGPAACTPSTNYGGGNCCRVCTTGKPCGNSCISRDKNCNVGGGCACYGNNAVEQLAGR